MEKTRKQRKYTKLMQVLISPSLDERLRQLSEEKQLRYSEIVRAALVEYLETKPGKKSQAKKREKNKKKGGIWLEPKGYH